MGRLVNQPEPYELDLERVIEVAHARGRFLELSARPERLDLSDVHYQLAKEKGVPVAIASGALAPAELDCVRFGVDRARRGCSSRRTSSTADRSTSFASCSQAADLAVKSRSGAPIGGR
jgi:DNA polymerase (family 10)